uniref:Uncharacterized protein n=1 Tax=Arundo donax TaxID=35708 RepID=A0A0A8XVE9_ARUDO
MQSGKSFFFAIMMLLRCKICNMIKTMGRLTCVMQSGKSIKAMKSTAISK